MENELKQGKSKTNEDNIKTLDFFKRFMKQYLRFLNVGFLIEMWGIAIKKSKVQKYQLQTIIGKTDIQTS